MSSDAELSLNDYRFALKCLADTRLVLELVTAHADLLDANDTDRPDLLDRYNAAKAEVLSRMDYEAGRPK
jgi:hypothetical protein